MELRYYVIIVFIFEFVASKDRILKRENDDITPRQFLWRFVNISDDCHSSSCTDGKKVGVRRYMRQCVKKRNNGPKDGNYDETIVDSSLCTSDHSKKEKLVSKCTKLPPCRRSKRPPRSKILRPDVIKDVTSPSKHGLNVISTSPEKQTGGGAQRPQSNTIDDVTSSSDVTRPFKVTSSITGLDSRIIIPWDVFIVTMTILGLFFLTVITCVSAAMCYIALCRNNGNRNEANDVTRRQQNLCERVSNCLQNSLQSKKTCPESPENQERPEIDGSQGVHLTPENARDGRINRSESTYWSIGDTSYEVVTSPGCDDDTIQRLTPRMVTFNLRNAREPGRRHEDFVNDGRSSLEPRNCSKYRNHGDHIHVAGSLSPSSDDETVIFDGKDEREASRDDFPLTAESCTTHPTIPTPQTSDEHDSALFDDIIDNLSTMRRELSNGTPIVSPQPGTSAGHVMYDATVRSSDPFITSSQKSENGIRSEFNNGDPRDVIVTMDTRESIVTSSKRKSPITSVFKPLDRNFGFFRGSNDFYPGKIVIDTTKPKSSASDEKEHAYTVPRRHNIMTSSNTGYSVGEADEMYARVHKVLRPMSNRKIVRV